jgi:4-hydroxy-tetrahydrodipicolinate reductase
MSLTLTIHGASGRMGQALVELVRAAPELAIGGLWDRAGQSNVDGTVGGQTISAPWATAAGDVIIDFSREEGLRTLLKEWPEGSSAALVSGTTGLDSELRELLAKRAERSPVFYAANMSQGIYALRMLARRAAELLDSDWDVELVEMHHNRKADAPSGTAAALIETVQEAWPEPLEPVYGRVGLPGPRGEKEMGVFSLRGGSVVGEHELIFAGPEETLRISHQAGSRTLFARGALRACRFVAQQPPGLYGMDDLVDF